MKKTLLLLATALLTAVSSFAETATLVTSTSDLDESSEYVLACPTASYSVAMSGVNPGKYFTPTEKVTITDGSFEVPATAAKIKLEKSGTNWKLKIGEDYIYCPKAKSAKLGTPGTSDVVDATITFTDNYVNLTYGSYGAFYYNGTDPRFMNYTSTSMEKVSLYKVDGGGGDTPVPTLGEITVTLPDGSTTVEDGKHEIMLGQSIVAAAKNAESIKIEAIHDDNTSYAVEANSWTPEKVGNHLVKVTATLGKDVKEHNFSLNVTPLPETTTDDLTVTYFGFSGSGYACKTKESEDTGVKYCSKAANSNGIQINTTGSKNATNSGIVSTENPNGYIIDRIEVTKYLSADFSKLIVSVSNSANSTINFSSSTMTETGVALAESALTGDSYITTSGTGNVYTYTPNGSYTYMGLTSTGAFQMTDVKVYYKAAPTELLVSGKDGELTSDMLSIDGFGGGNEWYPVTVIAPAGYTVYYNINSPRAKVDGVSLNAKANTEAAAMATAAEADDFTNSGKQAITIGLSSEGQFSVYAKNSNGDQTETKTFTVNGRATGVEDIAVDGVEDGEAVYYNMQGVRVANPAAGSLYIRVQGSKAAKVLVK